jgi:hypothetical protein
MNNLTNNIKILHTDDSVTLLFILKDEDDKEVASNETTVTSDQFKDIIEICINLVADTYLDVYEKLMTNGMEPNL